MVQSGMIIENRYEILNRIGSGGMSTVYKGRDQKLNRNVAIKILKAEYSEDKNFIRKFREEAQAAACLAHPNIVNVYDVGEEEDIHYIIMELVEGITLKNYIERKGKLTIKEASSIGIQVSMGLEVAHNNDIVHRDIKPQNIMISRDGKVKVMDFGIAKAATSETISSNAMGSVHYTSPEQARGGYSDAKSDIYSLGIVMYEMVTGRVPFDGDTTVAVAVKHLQEEMVSPSTYCPELPKSLEQIIFKCTEKAAAKRYGNMAEVIADLKQSLQTPDGDFVKRIDVDEAAKTVMITKTDLHKIKNESGKAAGAAAASKVMDKAVKEQESVEDAGRKSSDDPEEAALKETPKAKKEKKVVFVPPHRKEEPKDDTSDAEDYEDEYDEDEYDEDELDPRMEKILTIGGIATAIIIILMIVLLAGKVLGWGGSKEPENNEPGQEESVGEIAVPSVVGKSFDEAKENLNKLSLGIAVSSYETSEEHENNEIISQDLTEGTLVAANTTVQVVVCDNTSLRIEIPDVSDETKENAREILEEEGFKVEFEEEYDKTVEEGRVIETMPSAGTKMPKGETITVTVSLGAKEVTVPGVVKKSRSEAESLLRNEGLKVNVKEDYSTEVEEGLVIKSSPEAGATAEEGDTVTITVSLGVKQASVPNLLGKTQGQAKAALEEAGLKIGNVSEKSSDEYEKGQVMEQSVSSGSSVKADTAIDITISTGKKGVQVPAVVGVVAEEAKVRIDNAGLKFAIEEEYHDTVEKGVVISCRPGENTEVTAGSTVTIVVSKGKKPEETTTAATYKFSGKADIPSGALPGYEINVVLKDANGNAVASAKGNVGDDFTLVASGITTPAGTIEVSFTAFSLETEKSEAFTNSYAVEFTKE